MVAGIATDRPVSILRIPDGSTRLAIDGFGGPDCRRRITGRTITPGAGPSLRKYPTFQRPFYALDSQHKFLLAPHRSFLFWRISNMHSCPSPISRANTSFDTGNISSNFRRLSLPGSRSRSNDVVIAGLEDNIGLNGHRERIG